MLLTAGYPAIGGEQAVVSTFEGVYQNDVGSVTMFDRMIFRGYLRTLYSPEAFRCFLFNQGVLLKDFKPYVQQATATLKTHAQRMAAEADRPYQYLQQATTKRHGRSKEEVARDIAVRDDVTHGLVCVLATPELCTSVTVRHDRATSRMQVVRKQTKCDHLYYYFIDEELGWLHVKIQTWFPFDVQIWVNGHDWLARQRNRRGIAFTKYDHAITSCPDLDELQKLCDRFAHRRWPGLLAALARKVNPLVATIGRYGGGNYYWVLAEAEISTDVVFKTRRRLQPLLPDLFRHAMTAFSATDVMRFLGRKLHGNFAGEVTTEHRKRPEGVRIKHTMKSNSIKLYDKANVLRVETTINNPREFRVCRTVTEPDGPARRWRPMGSVANTYRYFQCGRSANTRYLDALATAPRYGEGIDAFDALCRPRIRAGRRHSRFRPLEPDDAALFQAVLAGEHAINGFRNHDLARRLYPTPPRTPQERRRRCQRVSRLISKLRGHGLVAKVPRARLYRPTERGVRLMTAAIVLRRDGLPATHAVAAP